MFIPYSWYYKIIIIYFTLLNKKCYLFVNSNKVFSIKYLLSLPQTNLLMKKDFNSQELILFNAFKLFLENNYKEVTIADIEKVIGMSRGAIFYYYKNKNELFNAVIDKYIIDKQSTDKLIEETEITSFKSFLEKYIQGIKNAMTVIMQAEVKNILRCYFNLIYSAINHYPGFEENGSLIIHNENKSFQKFLKLGIKTGEIRSDIDIKQTALTFQSIFYGLSYISSVTTHQEVLDLNILKKSFINYYNTIIIK